MVNAVLEAEERVGCQLARRSILVLAEPNPRVVPVDILLMVIQEQSERPI